MWHARRKSGSLLDQSVGYVQGWYKLTRALYGLKSSGAACCSMFSTVSKEGLGFTPTWVEPDVYYRKNIKPNGDHYYKYLLVYVDNVLLFSHTPASVMKDIGWEFQIKNDQYGPPCINLGAGISNYTLLSWKECWSMDSQQYVDAAINMVQKLLEDDGHELKTSKKTGDTHAPPPAKLPTWIGHYARMWRGTCLTLMTNHWDFMLGNWVRMLWYSTRGVLNVVVSGKPSRGASQSLILDR